jgi:hypothetical protein
MCSTELQLWSQSCCSAATTADVRKESAEFVGLKA